MSLNKPNLFGPPPVSPFYQGECYSTLFYNPYFPAPTHTWRPQPQFWYKGDPQPLEHVWPVGDPDDYKFNTLPQPLSDKTLLEEMEIERPERYLPGEIYKNQPVKSPVEDLSKTADCPKNWVPMDPRFCCEFKPTKAIMNPPTVLEGVLRRKADTFNSYLIPEKVLPVENCDCVEDIETKNIKIPNYLEALEYANTRPPDFKCASDTRVHFEDACKVSASKEIPPRMYKSSMDSQISKTKNSKDKCECGCKD